MEAITTDLHNMDLTTDMYHPLGTDRTIRTGQLDMPVLWIDVVEPAACGMDFIQGPSSFCGHDPFVTKIAILYAIICFLYVLCCLLLGLN